MQNDLEADLLTRLTQICDDIIAPEADETDRASRFPQRSVDALAAAHLLTVPELWSTAERSGNLGTLARMARIVAARCGSTAMIWAMNQIQLACLVRHVSPDEVELCAVTDRAIREQWLIASVTSEAGTGGDVGRSVAALNTTGSVVELLKRAPVVSYAEYAEAFLMTARTSEGAPQTDQRILLVPKHSVQLDNRGPWDMMGMRGTCSPGFTISARLNADMILSAPFAEVNSKTMTPYAHVLWSSIWLGLADDAVNKAITAARSNPRTATPGRTHLADALSQHTVADDHLRTTVQELGEVLAHCEHPTFKQQARLNTLKVATSEASFAIIMQCMLSMGMSSYSNLGPSSLTRNVRDSLSAQFMISNDRLRQSNEHASLLRRRT